jgi:hypothetical protein
LSTAGPTTWSENFLQSLGHARSSKDFGTISLDINETHQDTRKTERDVTLRQKEHFEEQKILSSEERRKEEILSTLMVIKDMGRVPKRLKTEDEPVVEAVKVKVESDGDNDDKEEEEESLDDDNDEERKDERQVEQVVQPVAQVERPRYVPPRPKYILMDYNKSMGDGVIPEDKVLRPKNRWCYTILNPVFWGENSIDRCLTYGV